MALYSIENDTCLGMTHCCPVDVESEGFVEISDEEVAKIVDLIRQKGTTDVGTLNLVEIYPDIYEKLDKAYHDMAYDAEEMHWLWYGYGEDGYRDGYELDELMSHCEENCGFEFEYDEEDYMENGELDEESLIDDKEQAFYDWLDDYLDSLSNEEAKDFFYNQMGANLDLPYEEVEYRVAIPDAIKMLA